MSLHGILMYAVVKLGNMLSRLNIQVVQYSQRFLVDEVVGTQSLLTCTHS